MQEAVLAWEATSELKDMLITCVNTARGIKRH
jgi:hypothetical protein